MKTFFLLGGILLLHFTAAFGQDTSQIGTSSVKLKGVWFTDEKTGYAVGNIGSILKTTDGGVFWNALKSVTPNSLYAISFSDKNNGIACGANGTILKTTDAGETWHEIPSGTLETLTEVFFLDEGTAYISGVSGVHLKSSNSGVTWTNISVTSKNEVDTNTTTINTDHIGNQKITSQKTSIVIALDHIRKAQNKDSLVSVNISHLDKIWQKYNNFSIERPAFEDSIVIPQLLQTTSTESNLLTSAQNKVNDEQIKQIKKDIGLKFGGNYTENFNPGIGTDDILTYKRRFQAGLDWNILGNGFLDNHYKQEILKNENTIRSLSPAATMSNADYLAISHKLIYCFNEQKIKILEKRQGIINDKYEVANELYLLKNLPKLEVMAIQQQQVDVISMMQIYQSYNEVLAPVMNKTYLPKNILPLFDIDPDKLMAYKAVNQDDSVLQLQVKNLQLTEKSRNGVNLSANLRYNFYDLVSATNKSRDFVSAGLTFSVPIPSGSKSEKDLIAAKSELMNLEMQKKAKAANLDFMNSFYEFRYKLKQYNNFLEKHRKYEELIRIERVKQKLNSHEFNPNTSLNLIDEMLTVEIEMLDLQQGMYLILLDIIAKTPGLKTSNIIHVLKKSETTENAMYVWSDVMSKYSAPYIDEYLRLNNVTTAIISINKEPKRKSEALAMFSILKVSGIKSELLISNNNLIFSTNPSEYFESLTDGLDWSEITALHLDVEPQALPDWEKNKDKYLKQYVEMLKMAQEYCLNKHVKLNVSIPVNFPENTLIEIYALCDKVYLMAYEHKDAFYVIKKVKEEFSIGASKTVIALRTQDFNSRSEFEKFAEELGKALNTTSFAIHSLGTYINLTK